MGQDSDKSEWQAKQAARDALLEKEREKHRKARERAARNAQRKLERLRRSLGEAGELSDWEDEFSESVTERLDKYGSAFQDLQKGRPGDALSFAQKRVVAALNKKAKDQRKAKRAKAQGEEDEDQKVLKSRNKPKPRSGFKSKNKPKYIPRVRQLDEEFEAENLPPPVGSEPFIPAYHRSSAQPVMIRACETKPTPPPKRPFLRIVKSS